MKCCDIILCILYMPSLGTFPRTSLEVLILIPREGMYLQDNDS